MKLDRVSVQVQGRYILRDISFQVRPGQWWMLVGPNGSGKTTLVKSLAGALAYSGQITIQGRDLASLSARERALKLGFLMQQRSVVFDYTGRELVELGRYAHRKGILKVLSKEDQEKVDTAMEATGTRHLGDQSVLTLSGGELQRIFLAQVFAQDPDILVLDEPTNHLDIRYEEDIFQQVASWLQGGSRAVITIVHDLSLAQQYGSHALLLSQGQSVAQGRVDHVFQSQQLNSVYDIDVKGYMLNKLQVWS